MKSRGLKRAAEIFWFSDSEPNEVLIAMCHLLALPATLVVDFHSPNLLFIAGSIAAGLFQIWSVLYNGTLRMRLIAVQIATLIAVMTVINLSMSGLLEGSRLGWVIILGFAVWNTVRVLKEKLVNNG